MISDWLNLPDLVPQFATQYFPQTNHTVSNRFLAYWNRYGQVLPLGYPLSDPFIAPGVRNPSSNT